MHDLYFAIYVHNKIPDRFGSDIKEILSKVEITSEKLFQWLGDHQMKNNLDNCRMQCNTDGANQPSIFQIKNKIQQLIDIVNRQH